MRQILAVCIVLVCGSARGNIIVLSQYNEFVETATIAQPVPVVLTHSNSGEGPVGDGGVLLNPGGIKSTASARGVTGATKQSGFLQLVIDAAGEATGDSPALYGVAAASASQTYQFTFDSTAPATFTSDIKALTFASGQNGDDVASISMSLSGGGMSVTQSVPTANATEMQFIAPINPVIGAVYTLSLSANISTDGISPLRQSFTSQTPAEAIGNVVIQQTPEPPTLALALAVRWS